MRHPWLNSVEVLSALARSMPSVAISSFDGHALFQEVIHLLGMERIKADNTLSELIQGCQILSSLSMVEGSALHLISRFCGIAFGTGDGKI